MLQPLWRERVRSSAFKLFLLPPTSHSARVSTSLQGTLRSCASLSVLSSTLAHGCSSDVQSRLSLRYYSLPITLVTSATAHALLYRAAYLLHLPAPSSDREILTTHFEPHLLPWPRRRAIPSARAKRRRFVIAVASYSWYTSCTISHTSLEPTPVTTHQSSGALWCPLVSSGDRKALESTSHTHKRWGNQGNTAASDTTRRDSPT